MKRCKNFFRCQEYVGTDRILCRKCDPKQYAEPKEAGEPSRVLSLVYALALGLTGSVLP